MKSCNVTISILLFCITLPASAMNGNFFCENIQGDVVSIDVNYTVGGLVSIESGEAKEQVQSIQYILSTGGGVPFTNSGGSPVGIDEFLISTTNSTYKLNFNRAYEGSSLLPIKLGDQKMIKRLNGNTYFYCWIGRDSDIDAINTVFKTAPCAIASTCWK